MADLRPVYVAGDGDVKGPANSSNNFLPLFAGTTGKLLKSSGTGVTTQGLAILDDNTPAEQRNTIGLDQVDNTSDINKPVSTAQQTALNLKQDNLLYTPVQQGGGGGQLAHKLYMGWSASSQLRVQVDGQDFGNTWPININGLSANATKLATARNFKIGNTTKSFNGTADVSWSVDEIVDLSPYAKGDAISYVGFAGDAVHLPYMRRKSDSQVYYLQPRLGYTPIQQGGGIGQLGDKVYIGWSGSRLKATVDAKDLGNVAFNLDSVDNTSDINKPVSTAQQAALDLKMNLTGDGANPWFGAVSVHASGLTPTRQGVYLFWNESGGGSASLVNNQGVGSGGFIFRNVNKDNTAETGRVTITGNGSLSSTGSITAAGGIYGGNGAVTVNTNGDIHGSLWGGWLSNYLPSVFLQTSNLMATIAAQGVGGIGTYAFLRNTSGATVGPGGQVAGTSLQWADDSSGTAGVVGYGSWRCMGHGYKGNSTVWMRYA